MKFHGRAMAGALFATEMLARMYGAPRDGETHTQIEQATRTLVRSLLRNVARLIHSTPFFSVRFSSQISSTLEQMTKEMR